MANQVVRWLPSMLVTLLALTPIPGLASGLASAHRPEYPDVTIEHAELVLSPPGIPDTVYLTIYNGTGDQISLVDVTANSYRNAAAVKRSPHLFGLEEVPAEDADLAIPAMSELEMNRNTVFITMERDGEPPKGVTFTIQFDDGSLQWVPARIVYADGARTSHHHGAPELE